MGKLEAELIDEYGKNDPPSGLVHTCSACGKRSIWGPNWAWYGSWKQYEEGTPIFKACSDACMAIREEVEARNKVSLQKSELEAQLKQAQKAVKKIEDRIAAIDQKDRDGA
ncbi:MAG TPA: hypothetical protein VFU31_29865 [Candidatus Binatia bacterium]|nr:hypothetical protein [Candidatus Binatia bacterium]